MIIWQIWGHRTLFPDIVFGLPVMFKLISFSLETHYGFYDIWIYSLKGWIISWSGINEKSIFLIMLFDSAHMSIICILITWTYTSVQS